MLQDLPTAFLFLPALSLAAGLDLYLTLLLLGLSPHTGLWDQPLPGALDDLDSLGVHLVAGGFYVMELLAERRASTAMVWNAFHAVIRPLAGALLALLLLDGEPTLVVAGGAALAALLASLVHSVRTGGRLLLWLRSAHSPGQGLLSAAEDALVVALVLASLDFPGTVAMAALVLMVSAVVRAPSDVRAFRFSVGLAARRAFSPLGTPRWITAEGLPPWVRDGVRAQTDIWPAAGVRGLPAGAVGLAEAPRFVTGWLVSHGGRPAFYYRRRGEGRRVDLEGLATSRVVEHSLFRRLDLGGVDSGAGSLCMSKHGPETETLEAEFRTP